VGRAVPATAILEISLRDLGGGELTETGLYGRPC
jgi:hypothetical protein